MSSADLHNFVQWIIPDVSKFGEEAKGLAAAVEGSLEALKETADFKTEGSQNFPTEWFAFWENPPLCILSCLLPYYSCCLASRTMAPVDSSYERELINNIVTSIICLGGCYHASRRTALRRKYNLKGSRGEDCLLSCFCLPCLACQEAIALHDLIQLGVPFAFAPAPVDGKAVNDDDAKPNAGVYVAPVPAAMPAVVPTPTPPAADAPVVPVLVVPEPPANMAGDATPAAYPLAPP